MNKPKRPDMTHITASCRHQTAAGDTRGSTDRRIRAFLNGETNGEDVLKTLYGHVADEPVPDRLRDLFKS